MCGNISVERSPIFSLLMPRSVTQYGREQMSMTARDSAYECFIHQIQRLRNARTNAHLVQGRESRSVPPDAAHLAQCLLERRSKSYRAVLCSEV